MEPSSLNVQQRRSARRQMVLAKWQWDVAKPPEGKINSFNLGRSSFNLSRLFSK